jgi:hypothetical protein
MKEQVKQPLTLDKPEYQNMTEVPFKPLRALKPIGVKLIWKADQRLTRLNQTFIDAIKTSIG